MSFIKLDSDNPKVTGKIANFCKQSLTDKITREIKYYLGITFENGETLLLFHSVLSNLIKEAALEGVLNPGDSITIEQTEKIEGKGKGDYYYNYALTINGKPYFSNYQVLTKEDFLENFK